MFGGQEYWPELGRPAWSMVALKGRLNELGIASSMKRCWLPEGIPAL